ncbi:uroporphyrinogen decarboxylase family protein [Desulfatiferula olefinivorans]
MTLTSRERVVAALQGRNTDRPPFTMTLSLYGAGLTGCPTTAYYRDPDRYVDGQAAVDRLVGPDILFAPFALPLEAEAFGSELTFLPNNPPNVKKPAFRNPEAFGDLRLPRTEQRPGLVYLRESVRLLSKTFRETKPVCAVIAAPVDLPALLMGIDMWIETLLFDEPLAQNILEKTGRHFVSLANTLIDHGADFIAIPVMFTHPSLLYPKMIEDIILPALRQCMTEVRGPIVFHHGGNPIVPMLQSYLDLPQVGAFAVDHRDSLDKARSILGPHRLLLGNLNGPALNRMPMKTVRERVTDILTDRKDDPCFVFATSAADVPMDTPPETLTAIAETIRSSKDTS